MKRCTMSFADYITAWMTTGAGLYAEQSRRIDYTVPQFHAPYQDAIEGKPTMASPETGRKRTVVCVTDVLGYSRVTGKRDTSDGARGILSLGLRVYNQREEQGMGISGTFLMDKGS